MVSSIETFHCIQDSQLGPNGVIYREVPLYSYLDCVQNMTNTVGCCVVASLYVIVCCQSFCIGSTLVYSCCDTYQRWAWPGEVNVSRCVGLWLFSSEDIPLPQWATLAEAGARLTSGRPVHVSHPVYLCIHTLPCTITIAHTTSHTTHVHTYMGTCIHCSKVSKYLSWGAGDNVSFCVMCVSYTRSA